MEEKKIEGCDILVNVGFAASLFNAGFFSFGHCRKIDAADIHWG
jgi:hypothetical protein